MWTFVLGMILSLLPRHWRAGERVNDLSILSRAAATFSGFVEAVLAVVGLMWWYSIFVATWAAKELDSALENGPASQLPGQAIGFSALLLWSIHPFTWLIAYFALEGLIRMLAAAFAGQIVATLPLAIVDWCYGKATGRALEGDALHVPSGKEQLRSFITAVLEQVRMARSPEVEDELFENVVGTEIFLEIRASRPKSEWVAPRIVRIGDRYFRLEESLHGAPPRTFVYRLRKLVAGVPGRTVIVYQAPNADARTISK